MEARATANGETEMMNTGGRSALGGRRYGEAKGEFAAPPANLAACGDSWYHAAAIEDEKSGRDH
jgi:uncharacterized protein DUF2735